MTTLRTLVLVFGLFLVASAGLGWWWQLRATSPADRFLTPGTPAEVLAAVRAEPPATLTVVNVWASWCEPCTREFPFFLRLRREFAARGVRVIFVSVDDGADFGRAESFLRAQGVDFPSFYKGTQSLNFVAEIFPAWTGAVPATIVFGPDSRVLDSWEGDTTWDKLVRRITDRLGAS